MSASHRSRNQSVNCDVCELLHITKSGGVPIYQASGGAPSHTRMDVAWPAIANRNPIGKLWSRTYVGPRAPSVRPSSSPWRCVRSRPRVPPRPATFARSGLSALSCVASSGATPAASASRPRLHVHYRWCDASSLHARPPFSWSGLWTKRTEGEKLLMFFTFSPFNLDVLWCLYEYIGSVRMRSSILGELMVLESCILKVESRSHLWDCLISAEVNALPEHGDNRKVNMMLGTHMIMHGSCSTECFTILYVHYHLWSNKLNQCFCVLSWIYPGHALSVACSPSWTDKQHCSGSTQAPHKFVLYAT
jgi:hypothetical protein